ncbi:uncharacterized protein Z520_04714 [Fonsecaea multimorphosa CBS 102226]|uniref:Transcription factor domain-containing protein n=1 Tax=Fonsecaea multimorphosa CBS 102226 TaxID=1442371 RepID=A0A0D2KQZ2_9EURO|nr:uncharacterized protein Z520_04714 [Fonsecaea multimorphosa CBS 102226]KIX99138.1 hypothetical protein Z520_04714 [Fonsecaea multimorphosa CBS 102226]OAL26050.1 hypothetical protein AYO22_04464 [Fonsecaea multimorphosa]
MTTRDLVFVDGLSWTKADKKIQISKVRAHARTIGVRTRESRTLASPVTKCVRQLRKKAPFPSVAHERSSCPWSPAAHVELEGSDHKAQEKLSLVLLGSHMKPLESRSENTSTPSDTEFDSSQNAYQTEVVVLDPDPYLRGYRKDPFNPIPENSCLDALDFYTQHYVPNNAPLYEVFNITNIYNRFPLLLLQHGLSMHAGLCNLLYQFEFFLDPAAKPSQRVYTHLGRALANLRREIKTNGTLPKDISTVLVMNLAVSARSLGDREAHEMHKEQLRLMIQAKGGLDQLGHGGLEKCMMLQWEGMWCWTDGRSPTIFPGARLNPSAERYPQYPFDEDIRGLVNQLPGGFQDLAELGILSVPTLEALLRATEELKRRKNKVPGTNDNVIFEYRRHRYHDFLQACPCLADSDEHPTLEKLIVLALILYCSANFCKQRLPTTHFAAVSARATVNLTRISMTSTDYEKKALVWVFMVVIDSWRSRGGQMRSAGVDLLGLFKQKFPAMKSWKDIANLLSRFLWSEDMENFLSSSWPDA